jgi:hypothetical protein
MAKGLLSLAWLALLGLAWALAPTSAQAWGEKTHPVKIDAGIDFRFNVYTVPNVVPRAPWYTYFPYDPHLMAPPPGSHYPTWPNPFPPRDASTPPSPPSQGGVPPSPNDYTPLTPRRPSIAATTHALQPVSYSAFQTPSYWYGR